MGLGGISPWSLVLILAIVLLLFGTKKLKGLGGDLGSAIKGFKNAMSEDAKKVEQQAEESLEKDAEEEQSDTVASKEKSETK